MLRVSLLILAGLVLVAVVTLAFDYVRLNRTVKDLTIGEVIKDRYIRIACMGNTKKYSMPFSSVGVDCFQKN